jgi:hypothetical protein
LTEEFQMQDKDYFDMVQKYNSSVKGSEPINYNQLIHFFHEKGIQGLNNGLSVEENQILFNTRQVPEMISLVLKGLATIQNQN